MEVRRYLPQKDVTSRYKNDERIVYSTGESIIETSDRIIFEESNEDQFYEVKSGYEGRLDLISYEVYGTPLYWWAIAAASGLYDPFEVNVGDILRIPPVASIIGR